MWCVMGGWKYLGRGATSCVCARYECPEIRMSPRILVAIKRRPAVSPSAYGIDCRGRLEAIFWNAGNAMGTGPEAASPPQLTAPHPGLPLTPAQHPQLPGSLGLSQQALGQRHFPAFLYQACSLACPREGELWAALYGCRAPASPSFSIPGILH